MQASLGSEVCFTSSLNLLRRMILCMKAATATRQLEAEQKKGGANSRKAKDLTKNIEQVSICTSH